MSAVRSPIQLLAPVIALGVMSASADTDSYTVDDLNRIEADKQKAADQLKAIEGAVENAGQDLNRINARLIAAAQESRRREEQATIIERRLIDLNIRADTVRRRIYEDEKGLEELIAALVMASSRRPPALMTSPNHSGNAVRSAILMSEAAPELQARAEALEVELTSLGRLVDEIEVERVDLVRAEEVLAAKRLEIETLAATKRAKYEDVTGEAEAIKARLAVLSEEAETIRELLSSLTAAAPSVPGRKPSPGTGTFVRPDAPRNDFLLSQRPNPDSKLVRLSAPAAGELKLKYGQKTVAGTVSDGLVIETRMDAQVTAPTDGRIEYAGTFRSYGQMLILRTGDGYHIILSGLTQLYGTPGQWVVMGEPVGRMSDRQAPPPQLYMELRKEGAPIDPSDWMTSSLG